MPIYYIMLNSIYTFGQYTGVYGKKNQKLIVPGGATSPPYNDAEMPLMRLGGLGKYKSTFRHL